VFGVVAVLWVYFFLCGFLVVFGCLLFFFFISCLPQPLFSHAVGRERALEAAALHPAQALKIDHRKGTLEYGTDADFVLLNDTLEVQATYIAGVCVYTRQA
jgi:alpha-D-ribose 1-methylphosphonate 5-triphosphate diphosphatase PhnM